MSTVIIVTPLVIAAWPSIAAAVTAAIGTMGFALAASESTSRIRVSGKQRAEIQVEDSEILDSASGMSESLVVERDGIRASFSRDVRGALKVCVEGDSFTKIQLKKIGEELIERVTQQFVYNRVVTELKERHMSIVDEEVEEDRTIRIRVRSL